MTRDQPHFIEPQRLLDIQRRAQVAEVYRVEGSAEDA
jgi:hypothetical protein